MWMDLNHRVREEPDLQSGAIDRSATHPKSLKRCLVGLPRFELGASCPPDTRANLAALQPDQTSSNSLQNMVELTGIEPATFCLQGRCSPN